jgi:hypothetical protein
MYFAEYLNQWAAATPTQNISCRHCFTITCPQTTPLQHSKINEIIIPIEGQLATQFLLRVHSHLCDKPWRVISEFLFMNLTTRSISIPIITPYYRLLRRGEPVCHFTLCLPNQCLQSLRGNSPALLFFFHTKRSTHFCLHLFFIFPARDMIFFSEDEEEEEEEDEIYNSEPESYV